VEKSAQMFTFILHKNDDFAVIYYAHFERLCLYLLISQLPFASVPTTKPQNTAPVIKFITFIDC
jgi:hypothetical protein